MSKERRFPCFSIVVSGIICTFAPQTKIEKKDMKIALREVSMRELTDGYVNNGDEVSKRTNARKGGKC